MAVAIRVESLGKHYRINHAVQASPYRTLRESLTSLAAAPLRRLRRRPANDSSEEFWALKDVNFDIRPGEVVGIIGRNGAGKSTLLKILSRITRPTTGRVRLNGRVGSLLEVGTGFHPELTGRENIYLNGAILGMSRREIASKFDDIVNFAELEKFLDTPVKRYSSGMYVRLAFSVAAHINPEILLVDEVLAVGDIAFQKKCLGQMGTVARGGRTVIFVSHQLEALVNLCPHSMMLERGRVVMHADTRTVIDRYLANQKTLMQMPLGERPDRVGKKRFRFTDTWIEDLEGQRRPSIMAGQPARLVVTYELAPRTVIRRPAISFALYTTQGVPVTRLLNAVSGHMWEDDLPPRGRIECQIPRLPLNVGQYIYNVLAETGPECEMEDWVQGVGCLTVEQGDFFGTGKLIEPKFPLLVEQEWTLSASE
jgi:lipopolysaccharide transport system ATP-binding protein